VRVIALSLVALASRAAFADPPPTATAAWGDQRVAPASTTTAADVTFREHVATFAGATHRHVAAWGTLLLDHTLDGAHPRRFATLMPDADGRGAYVVEVGPAVAVMVLTFDVDGRTSAFGAEHDLGGPVKPGTPPAAWTARPDPALVHSAGHHRGGEDFAISLDHDSLVLDRYRFVDDAREPSKSDTDKTYRIGGICKPRCPAVGSQTFQDSGLAVGGVLAFGSPLVEPR
jgi:hypothetical protein